MRYYFCADPIKSQSQLGDHTIDESARIDSTKAMNKLIVVKGLSNSRDHVLVILRIQLNVYGN